MHRNDRFAFRRPHLRGRRQARNAFTLVELLAAVLLTALLAASAARITVQSVRIRSAVEDELAQWRARVGVFDTFEADVTSAIQVYADGRDPLVFPEETHVLLEVSTLATRPDTQSLFRRRHPAQVRYVLSEKSPSGKDKTLFRDTRFLTEANGTVYREKLASGLSEARVERYDGERWYAERQEPTDKPESPYAVRLICRWRNEPAAPQTRTVVLRIPSDASKRAGSNL